MERRSERGTSGVQSWYLDAGEPEKRKRETSPQGEKAKKRTDLDWAGCRSGSGE